MDTTATVDETTTGVLADDLVRLGEMREMAERVLRDAGLPADRYKAEVNWNRQLSVGEWRRGGGMAVWSLTVDRPRESLGDHIPATFQFSGQMTPLAMRIVALLDALMWGDREL